MNQRLRPVFCNRNLFPSAPLLGPLRNEWAWRMSDRYIIEVSSQAAGIVVRTPDGYLFFAADPRFSQLEGRLFRNAREAERAAVRQADGSLKEAA